MNCLITFFSMCLFDPSAILLEGDMSWAMTGEFRYWHDQQLYEGALGRFALTVDVPATDQVSLRYGIEHRSYVEIGDDRGGERAFVGLVWRPFIRQ